jgi:hypothetical protein
MYEYWLSKWEIITIETRFFAPYLLAPLALTIVVVYVVSRIYGIGKPLTRRSLPWLIIMFIPILFVIYGMDLTAPEMMGFAVGGGRLVVDVGWWGVPSGRLYNLSDCGLEWINASTTRIWRVGYGGPYVTVGMLSLTPHGIKGYGMVTRDAEWILVARCPDATYILGAPGLNPRVVHD